MTTMTAQLPGSVRRHLAALRALLVLTVITGILYPLVVLGIGQLAFPAQAGGSLVRADGHVVGSSLLGQAFTDAQGNPLPQWFHSQSIQTVRSPRTSRSVTARRHRPMSR
jgi:potassium-transporting ATPase KdpC subunit